MSHFSRNNNTPPFFVFAFVPMSSLRLRLRTPAATVTHSLPSSTLVSALVESLPTLVAPPSGSGPGAVLTFGFPPMKVGPEAGGKTLLEAGIADGEVVNVRWEVGTDGGVGAKKKKKKNTPKKVRAALCALEYV